MPTTSSNSTMGPVEYFRAKLEHEIDPLGLKTILDRTPHLVCVLDVRERADYDDDHIPGARSVPIDALVSSFASLPKDRILVTCGADLACGLSARAALEMAQKGFRVQSLIGGLGEWRRRSYPTETSPGEATSQAW
jgi:rhodanese-related sulfurtransferase